MKRHSVSEGEQQDHSIADELEVDLLPKNQDPTPSTKNDRPLNDYYQGLVVLQLQNGIDMGVGLRSRFSATAIIDHNASEMRFKSYFDLLLASDSMLLIYPRSNTILASLIKIGIQIIN